jgi:hypothetical protein
MRNYVGFYFDDGTTDNEGDRFVWVRRSARRGLYARLYQPGTHANGKFLTTVRVWRPNRRSVRINIRPRQLGDALSEGYRWRVTTSFESADSKAAPKTTRFRAFPPATALITCPVYAVRGCGTNCSHAPEFRFRWWGRGHLRSRGPIHRLSSSRPSLNCPLLFGCLVRLVSVMSS